MLTRSPVHRNNYYGRRPTSSRGGKHLMASADISAISMRTFLTPNGKEEAFGSRFRPGDRKMYDLEIKTLLARTNNHQSTKPEHDHLFGKPVPTAGRTFGLTELPGASTSSAHSGLNRPSQPTTTTTTISAPPPLVIEKVGTTTNGILAQTRQQQPKAMISDNDADNGGRASSCSDRAADNEVSETLKSSESGDRPMQHNNTMLVPNKWQVLYFVAHTKALRIKRTGCELQVTDTANFPLFDVFQKSHCFRCTWILESYGKPVLIIVDGNKGIAKRNGPPVFNVINAESEEVGNFVTGDPFVIQNADKAIIARFASFEGSEPRLRNWQCILEGTGQEICLLEHRKPQVYIVRFSGQMGFTLKLLILAAAVQIAASPSPTKNPCCAVM